MKLPDKILKTAQCAWLYATGDLVIKHETQHPKAGCVNWVTRHKVPQHCRLGFTGRIVIHQLAVLRLLPMTVYIVAKEPSPINGSNNTKELGLSVGYITLQIGPRPYNDGLTFYSLPDILSGSFTYQPKIDWTEPEEGCSRLFDYPLAA